MHPTPQLSTLTSTPVGVGAHPQAEELHEQFRRTLVESSFRVEKDWKVEEACGFLGEVLAGRTPGPIPKGGFGQMLDIILHQHLQEAGYYGRITTTVADTLASIIGSGTVLDLGAGRGYAVQALQERGVLACGVDDFSWSEARGWGACDGVVKMDAMSALETYGQQVGYVILSWVPYESTLDAEALSLVREKFPHITIIAIGEGAGGCTGSERFWDSIHIDYWLSAEVDYETTYGLHDMLVFCR